MYRKWLFLVVTLFVIGSSAMAEEGKLSVGRDDTVRSVLLRQVGKGATLKLNSGEELGGTVRFVGDRAVHLGEISGREFYDAVVNLEEVAAAVIRTR